jgi:hypothetical protein
MLMCMCSFENGYGRDGTERNLIRVSTSLDGVWVNRWRISKLRGMMARVCRPEIRLRLSLLWAIFLPLPCCWEWRQTSCRYGILDRWFTTCRCGISVTIDEDIITLLRICVIGRIYWYANHFWIR